MYFYSTEIWLTSLVSPMRVLISWGTDDNDNEGIGIDVDSGGRGRQSAHLAATATLAAWQTCWQGTPATATSAPPPQGRGWWSAPHGPVAGMRIAPLRHDLGGNAGKGCFVAQPARVGARLRLDAPRQGENR